MKHNSLIFLLVFFLVIPLAHASEHGVAIQKIITNTRSELGQLATSTKATQIASLMKTFDQQYKTWNESCGGENFDPDKASDACKVMVDQMRNTGVKLYGKLGEYLPDVAAKYEHGARSASSIVQSDSSNITPAQLYGRMRDGVAEPGSLPSDWKNDDSPFPNQDENSYDPTDDMFKALESLVPDMGKETPPVVRAANAQITMARKAKKARYLARQFEKAKFILESQREYGKIIFGMTKALTAMPKVLRLQYSTARLTAVPNQKVIQYYRNSRPATPKTDKKPSKGGFGRRS